MRIRLLIPLLVVGGCADAPDTASGGIRVVADTTFREIVSIVPRRATLKHEWSYGSGFDGPEEDALSDIHALAVGPGGEVYVDEYGRGIRRIRPDGAASTSFSRSGQGPGEVDRLYALDATDQGVWALDVGNSRITVWTPDGELIREMRIRPTRFAHRPLGLFWIGDSTFTLGLAPSARLMDERSEWPRPLAVRRTLRSERADTVRLSDRYLSECPVLPDPLFQSGVIDDLREPYLPRIKWAPLPHRRLVIGCPATPSFEIVGETSVVRVIRDWEPIEVESHEHALFVNRTVTGIRLRGPSYENVRWSGEELPARRPFYSDVHPGERGRIWIRRVRARVEVPEEPRFIPILDQETRFEDPPGSVWEVFDPDGTLLGTVEVPPEITWETNPLYPVPVVRGDSIWAVTTDDLDVQYVSLYRVGWDPTDAHGVDP